MFRSATTRIAHNSTVPAFARIHKDLKVLQEMINTEKSFMQTLQKTAQELAKTSEALKGWGNGEGDDLGDTLASCNALLAHWVNALNGFATHEASVRELMKAVRSREENLEELRRKRKSLQSSADSADRKLSKMSAENKNFQAQADALNKLRDEIRSMDSEIMTEEASLGDFKRTSAKNWLGVKFGALMECCEKGAIVAELGKLVIAEIPLEPTEPGLPRPYYTGHARTELLVAEAQRAISDVVYSPEPNRNPNIRGIRMLPGSELPPMAQGQIISRPASTQVTGGSVGSSTPDQSVRNSTRYSQSIMSPPGTFIGLPEVSESTSFSPYMGPEHVPALSRSPPPGSAMSVVTLSQTNPFASPPMQNRQLSMSNSDVSEFGAYPPPGAQFAPRTSSLRNLGDSQPSSPVAGGPRGKFATFPVKMTGPRAQPGTPQAQQYPAHSLDSRAPSLDIDGSSDDFSASVAQALGHRWSTETGAAAAGPAGPGVGMPNVPSKKEMEAHQSGSPMDYTSPPPQYSLTVDTPSTGMLRAPSSGTISTPTVPEEDESDQGDAGLAYAGTTDDEASAAPASDDRRRSSVDRRVKFEDSSAAGEAQGEQSADLAVPGPSHGESQDETQSAVGSDAQHDIAENSLLHRGPEQQQQGEETVSESGHQKEETIRASQQLPPVPQEQGESQAPSPIEPPVNHALPEIPPVSEEQHIDSPPPPTQQPILSEMPRATSPTHVPPPPSPPPASANLPLSPEEEKSLNAAAAREVQREMDSFMFRSLPPPGGEPIPPPPPPPVQPVTAPLQLPASPYPLGRTSPAGPDLNRDTPAAPLPPLKPSASRELPTIPTQAVPGWVRERERDRSPSITSSPRSEGHNGYMGRIPPPQLSRQQSPVAESPTTAVPPTARATSPPSITLPLRSSSPFTPGAYRTPGEFPPTPSGPGAFYNLPALAGSGSLPASGRKVAAGLFKRQARSATTPTSPEVSLPSTQGQADVSPLNVKKKRSSLSNSGEGPGTPRMSPVPPPHIPEAISMMGQGQNGSRASLRPQGPGQLAAPPSPGVRASTYDSSYGDEDHFDYISAYVDDDNGEGEDRDRRASNAGYGQSRYSTNLENGRWIS